jgi:hypothetical protein
LSSQQEAAKQGTGLFTNGKLAVEPIITPTVTCAADRRFGNSDLAGADVEGSGERPDWARNSFPKSRHVVLVDASWASCLSLNHV